MTKDYYKIDDFNMDISYDTVVEHAIKISKADFKGKIKNNSMKNVLGFENGFVDGELVITIDFEAKIQALEISAKTSPSPFLRS